jgi:hypothetical protein
MLKKWHYVLIIGLLLLGMGAVIGWNLKKCPTSQTTTVHVYDTVFKEIPVVQNHYIIKYDTIVYTDSIPVLPTKEDTARILDNFYEKHYVEREWKDTLLIANETAYISQNKIFPLSFKYKYLGATTINNTVVDNTSTYYSYVNAGLTMLLNDPKYWGVKGTLNTSKFYVGVGYHPSVKGYSVEAGIPIVKFKKIR